MIKQFLIAAALFFSRTFTPREAGLDESIAEVEPDEWQDPYEALMTDYQRMDDPPAQRYAEWVLAAQCPESKKIFNEVWLARHRRMRPEPPKDRPRGAPFGSVPLESLRETSQENAEDFAEELESERGVFHGDDALRSLSNE